MRPWLLSWFAGVVGIALGAWGAITAYNLGRITIASEVRALRVATDSLLITHGDGICRKPEPSLRRPK